MKGNGQRVGCIIGILVLVYSLVIFLLPFERSEVFWLSYGFAMMAILSQLHFLNISFQKGVTLKSKFYGVPIARLGVLYVIVQCVLSIVFMALSQLISVVIPLILYVVLLGGTAIGTITVEGVREELIRQDVQLKKKISTMRSLQSQMNSLIGLCNDETLKNFVEKLAEEVKYSDLVSNEATETIENDLLEQVNHLQEKILDNAFTDSLELTKKIQITLNERNRLCKLNK